MLTSEEALESRLRSLEVDARRLLDHHIEDALLKAAVSVMSSGHDSYRPAISPDCIDRLAQMSWFVTTLATAHPSIAGGPLERSRQIWMSCKPPPWLSARLHVPERQAFQPPEGCQSGNKQFGLFTSTAARASCTMWRVYVEHIPENVLHGLPWYSWSMKPTESARVIEINGACDWLALVGEHGVDRGSSIDVDWASVAREADLVHLTMAGVIATHGFQFPLGDAVTVAHHWDVEQTLWLNWVVESAELVCVDE